MWCLVQFEDGWASGTLFQNAPNIGLLHDMQMTVTHRLLLPIPQVLYGMDYLTTERDTRLAGVRDALLSHLRFAPDALVVVEEYDKLDCDTRGMFRQLLQHPEVANVSWNRWVSCSG